MGVAIRLRGGKIIAPFDGAITSTYNSNHCLVIRSEEGMELFIHIGLDTIKLKGKGFTQCVSFMDKAKQGETILDVDLDSLKEK